MQNLKFRCPGCNHTLYRGTLAFGPNTVTCKRCEQVIGLDLTPWSQLSFWQKVGNIIKEVLAPSFLLGIDSAFIRFLILAPACWALFAFPFTFPLFFFVDSSRVAADSGSLIKIFSGLAIAGTLVYPLYVVYRIIKIARNSSLNIREGLLPRW